jgi:hypothetical protein
MGAGTFVGVHGRGLVASWKKTEHQAQERM